MDVISFVLTQQIKESNNIFSHIRFLQYFNWNRTNHLSIIQFGDAAAKMKTQWFQMNFLP